LPPLFIEFAASVLISGIDDKQVLNQAFAVVKSFRPMNETEVTQLISKLNEAAVEGKYELFKMTSHFDTIARHPDWLGSDSPPVQKLAPELPG
jgi:hypothetical protein